MTRTYGCSVISNSFLSFVKWHDHTDGPSFVLRSSGAKVRLDISCVKQTSDADQNSCSSPNVLIRGGFRKFFRTLSRSAHETGRKSMPHRNLLRSTNFCLSYRVWQTTRFLIPVVAPGQYSMRHKLLRCLQLESSKIRITLKYVRNS